MLQIYQQNKIFSKKLYYNYGSHSMDLEMNPK